MPMIVTEQEVSVVRRMAAEGDTDGEIAAALGRNRQWVFGIRREHHIAPGNQRGMGNRRRARRKMPRVFDLEDTEEL